MAIEVLTTADLEPVLMRLAQLETKVGTVEKQLDRPVTIAEACKIIKISRSSLYDEMRRAEQGQSKLKAVAYGRKKVLMYLTCIAFRESRELGQHRRAA